MKAPAHTAFLDLEEALAARLRQSWSRYWSALSADILHLTAQGKFDEAHRLADTLELAPLFDKARPYARTIGMSALLLGASRITPSIRDSRIAKLPPKDKLDGYLNQLNVMLARNATQALREQVHLWITEEEQKLVKGEWREEDHPRGKTTPESTPGSFMPKVNWYHGTLTDVLDQILKEGIKPGSETGKRRWGPQFYQDPARAESVFVASNMPQAEGWAIDAAYNIEVVERSAGNPDAPLMTPVVLEVEVPRDVAEQSVKDNVTQNEFHRMHRGRIPPEWIKGYTIIQLKRVGPMGFIEVADRKHHALRKSDRTFYVVVMVRETAPVQKADADRNQVKIMTAGKQYFALAASVQVSRLSAFGFLAEAAETGVTNYRVDAVLDERTCEVCRHMDGWVFPVDAGLALATQIMETDDPDTLKSIAPFYAQNKGSLAALATYGTEDFIETGMSLPPYHPLCRCILTPTEETADVHPTDRSDRVALASQALYGEGDGVRLTQNLFGVERVPEEADTVEAPVAEEESRLLEMLGQLVTQQVPATEPEWQQQVLSRLLAPEVQPDALVSPTPFEGTTIPSRWVKPFDPARMAQLATSKWPWLAALLGWMALRPAEQASAFATDDDEEDEEDIP